MASDREIDGDEDDTDPWVFPGSEDFPTVPDLETTHLGYCATGGATPIETRGCSQASGDPDGRWFAVLLAGLIGLRRRR